MTETPEISLDEFRSILLSLRGRISGDARQMQVDASASNAGTPTHLADAATDTNNQEFTLNRLSVNSETLQEIDDALDRIENGTFGKCVECDEPVPLRRLKIKPYASLCIECKRQEEEG